MKRTLANRTAQRALLAGAALAATALLAACGSGASGSSQAPATVESASGSGEVAGWGTKGVEATFINPYDREVYDPASQKTVATYRISVRGDYNGANRRTIGPTQSTTFTGDSVGSDDLEFDFAGPFTDSISSLEFDFSNPTMGCPNATVGYDMRQFCSEGTKAWWEREVPGSKLRIQIERIPDSSDNKRFEIKAWVMK